MWVSVIRIIRRRSRSTTTAALASPASASAALRLISWSNQLAVENLLEHGDQLVLICYKYKVFLILFSTSHFAELTH